jgi:hypothetical protein
MSNIGNGAERRQFGRRRTFLHGWIKLQGRAPVACVVRDFSEGGALLEVPENTWLPFRFSLAIESERFSAECEIRHQRESNIGVCFVQRTVEPIAATRTGSDDVGSWYGKQGARTVRQ